MNDRYLKIFKFEISGARGRGRRKAEIAVLRDSTLIIKNVTRAKISVLCLLAGVAGRSVALLTSAQNDYVAG